MKKIAFGMVFLFTLSLLSISCNKKSAERTVEQTQTQERQDRSQRGGDQKRKPPKFSDLLAQMDANKDGKLGIDEVTGRLKEDFSSIDANRDGFITEEELKAKAPRGGQRGGQRN